jgi:hypothetical protein
VAAGGKHFVAAPLFKPVSGKEYWKFRLSRQQPPFNDRQMEDILSQHLSMLEENLSHLTNH